jgi:hypothetical protein
MTPEQNYEHPTERDKQHAIRFLQLAVKLCDDTPGCFPPHTEHGYRSDCADAMGSALSPQLVRHYALCYRKTSGYNEGAELGRQAAVREAATTKSATTAAAAEDIHQKFLRLTADVPAVPVAKPDASTPRAVSRPVSMTDYMTWQEEARKLHPGDPSAVVDHVAQKVREAMA